MRKSIWDHVASVPDPRVERTKKHELQDILVIAVCGVICGAEHWTDIEAFGKVHEGWFRTFLDLPNGIPSHDIFGRVFAALDADAFEAVLRAFVEDLAGSSRGKYIAIDGKTLRGSVDRASSKAPLHTVSAWIHENHVVFGQLAVEVKSNEITAIPELLTMLDVEKATVTIDAIGSHQYTSTPTHLYPSVANLLLKHGAKEQANPQLRLPRIASGRGADFLPRTSETTLHLKAMKALEGRRTKV